MTSRKRPEAGEFISWSNPAGPGGVVTMLVEAEHRNGHILRGADGDRDQFDSLPRSWRPASLAEIATFKAGVAS